MRHIHLQRIRKSFCTSCHLSVTTHLKFDAPLSRSPPKRGEQRKDNKSQGGHTLSASVAVVTAACYYRGLSANGGALHTLGRGVAFCSTVEGSGSVTSFPPEILNEHISVSSVAQIHTRALSISETQIGASRSSLRIHQEKSLRDIFMVLLTLLHNCTEKCRG